MHALLRWLFPLWLTAAPLACTVSQSVSAPPRSTSSVFKAPADPRCDAFRRAPDVLSFSPSTMTLPKRIDGPEIPYPPEARAFHINGTMRIDCVITAEGAVRQCILRDVLPYIGEPAIAALESARYRPALLDGKPVSVDYSFVLRIEDPNPPPLEASLPPAGARKDPSMIPERISMTRPTRVSGSDPVYTIGAMCTRAEGHALVQCRLSTEGEVRSCRLLKTVPYMDRQLLSAMESQRFTPMLFQGRPISINYVFNVNLRLDP